MSRRTSSHVFVGRQAELDELGEALAHATAGQPSMVLVAGEAGIGKTRFVAEFAGHAEASGARVAVGGCLDVADGGLPYAPFVEALRHLKPQLDAVSVEAAFGPYADVLSGSFVDLGRSADAGVGIGPSASADPVDRRARLFDAVIGVLGRLSTERPLVLVLEDLHWADGSTRDLIRFLARNLRDERLLLIATYRTDDLHRRHPIMPLLAELARADRVERMDLPRLDRAELDQLLAGLIGGALNQAVGDALLERSDGLPFYVEELVAGKVHDGAGLPSSLRDILERRLAGLSPDALTVIRTASVIGGRCSHARLATATALDPDRLMDALREASESGILIPGEDADGPVYGFRHALLREASYDDLLPAERGRLHGEVADALEATIRDGIDPGPAILADLALHAYLAHDLPRALEGSCRALAALIEVVAYREALVHAERALELWPRVADAERRAGMDHARLLTAAGRMASAANQPERATEHFVQALDELAEDADVAVRVELLIDLQLAAWDAEAYDVSSRAAEEAYDLCAPDGPTRLRIEATMYLGADRWWSGRLRESATLLEEAIEIARETGDGAAEAEASAILAHTRSDLGQGVWTSRLIARSLASVPADARGFGTINSQIDLSIAAWACGRFADAEHLAAAGLDLAIRYGWEARIGHLFRVCLSDAVFELGRYEDAEAIARQVREGDGIRHSRDLIANTLYRGAIARGRLDHAQPLITDAQSEGTEPGHYPYVQLARLELARAEGRFSEAAAIVDPCADAISTVERVMPDWQILALGIGTCADEATTVRRRRRSIDGVAAHAERWFAALTEIDERVRSEGGGGPWFDTTFATARAEMGRLQDRSDPAAWAAVADQWIALLHPFQTAYARLRLAEAILRTSGERSAAERELRSAHSTASSIGAGLLLPEIEALAADARIDLEPDGAPVSHGAGGPAVEMATNLTRRESAVLRLVADGHTNREIGDQLFISEKTVSVHVSNAMAKLGALSRYEAAATAQRLGLLRP